MHYPRSLAGLLARALGSFPAVLVSGPRQSGKTTLLKRECSATHRYLSLENLDVRERALADPVGFLRDHPPPVVLDEIQHAPALLTYIQTASTRTAAPAGGCYRARRAVP
jgi:predicted AAA+ superfamily ATPase